MGPNGQIQASPAAGSPVVIVQAPANTRQKGHTKQGEVYTTGPNKGKPRQRVQIRQRKHKRMTPKRARRLARRGLHKKGRNGGSRPINGNVTEQYRTNGASPVVQVVVQPPPPPPTVAVNGPMPKFVVVNSNMAPVAPVQTAVPPGATTPPGMATVQFG